MVIFLIELPYLATNLATHTCNKVFLNFGITFFFFNTIKTVLCKLGKCIPDFLFNFTVQSLNFEFFHNSYEGPQATSTTENQDVSDVSSGRVSFPI